MSTLSRWFAAALTVAMVLTLAVAVEGAATASAPSASAAAPDAGSTAADATGGTLDLGSDGVLPHQAGRAARIRTWKVRTLHYYETLPATWDWSLSTAVAKWNAAGGRIKLARTTVPGKAQVRIGYASIGSAAGMATVGSTKHAYVHLSSRFSSMDAVNAHNRVTIMNVLAHELGHVLGFQHTTARCSLMSPVIDIDACNVLPAIHPGYYKCRTLDTALVRRFVKLYGGRARYPGTSWCLIDPLPQALSGVTFTGGTTSTVTVHWKRPTSVPAGSSLVLKRWQASTCSTAPTWADTFRPSMTSGVWQDQVTYEAEVACFQVQLLNRYGAGHPAQKRILPRWVPGLDPPVIGVPSYDVDSAEFTFSASVPDGATLRAWWDADSPTTCVTSPTSGTDSVFVDVVGSQGTLAAPDVLPQCVSFFAVDPEHNRVSVPTFVTLDRVDASAPAAPVIEDPIWDPVRPAFLAPATYPEGTHLVYDTLDDPKSCPADYTHGQAVTENDSMGEGVIGFMTESPDQCVSFYAVDDDSGVASAPTTLEVQAPLPTETPEMGPITMLDKNLYPWRQAEFTGLEPGDHIGYAVFAGSCPETAPLPVDRWRTQLQNSSMDTPGHENYGLFPSKSSDVNCLVYTSLDWFGWQGSLPASAPGAHAPMMDRHGPIMMREFVDEGPLPPTAGTPVWNSATQKSTIPVSNTVGLHVVWDPSDPTTCPPPDSSGLQQVSFTRSGDDVVLAPPWPEVCVTFYNVASEGPAPTSFGTGVWLSARPASPTIGDVTWDATTGQFSAPMSTAAGTHVVYGGVDPDGPGCLTAKPTNAPTVTVDAGGIGTFYTLYPQGCVTFWSVDDKYGATSRPTNVTIDVPLPTETLTVSNFALRPRWYPTWSALLSGAAPGDTPAFATLAGPCPDMVPSGIQWDTRTGADYNDSSSTKDYAYIPSRAAGTNCALFTSLDWFGWPHRPGLGGGTVVTDFHGPVVMREFVDNGPVTPTVTEQPVWNASTGKFRFAVSDDWNLKAVYDPADPTTCPQPSASGLQQVTLLGAGPLRFDVAPPVAHTCLTLYTASNSGWVDKSVGVPLDLVTP